MRTDDVFYVVYNKSYGYYVSVIGDNPKVTKNQQLAYLFKTEAQAYKYRKTPSYKVCKAYIKITDVFIED